MESEMGFDNVSSIPSWILTSLINEDDHSISEQVAAWLQQDWLVHKARIAKATDKQHKSHTIVFFFFFNF